MLSAKIKCPLCNLISITVDAHHVDVLDPIDHVGHEAGARAHILVRAPLPSVHAVQGDVRREQQEQALQKF